MRSFIVFALVALAFCQSPLDAINGFSTQLNINNTDALNCVSGLYAEVMSALPLYKDLLSQDFESLIVNGMVFVQGLEPAVQTACSPLLQDLITYTITYGNGVDLKTNLELNDAYVAQQVALLVEAIAYKNFSAIGSTVGYIFQIVVGAVDLPSLYIESLNSRQISAFQRNNGILQTNTNGAMKVFLQSYVDELGIQINVSDLLQLMNSAQRFAGTVQTFKSAIRSGNFDSDITATKTFANAALEFIRANQKGVQALIALEAPEVLAFYDNPIPFIGSVIFNCLLHAPEILGFQKSYVEAMIAGDFAGLGVKYATSIKYVFGALYGH